MNHVLIFAVFLPVLVFGSALTIELHKLWRQLVPVALLAVAGERRLRPRGCTPACLPPLPASIRSP